jgi:hypothetical protein
MRHDVGRNEQKQGQTLILPALPFFPHRSEKTSGYSYRVPPSGMEFAKGEFAYMNRKIQRGDMYYADLTPTVGSEQDGIRPILIIQNDAGNKHSTTVIAAVITGRTRGKARLPTHWRWASLYVAFAVRVVYNRYRLVEPRLCGQYTQSNFPDASGKSTTKMLENGVLLWNIPRWINGLKKSKQLWQKRGKR